MMSPQNLFLEFLNWTTYPKGNYENIPKCKKTVECVTNWLRYDQWRTTGGGGGQSPNTLGSNGLLFQGGGGVWAVAQYFGEQWSFAPRQSEM